ncbi:hypothetical protein [Rhodococcus jostii]|uniref:hypothetical protein n=1 Tax=Rhodococcus jostii TaxID=132919 RepID=UPI003642FBDD
MLTSITTRIAAGLRGLADALDPKPASCTDFSSHVKDSGLGVDFKDELKRLQTMTASGRL